MRRLIGLLRILLTEIKLIFIPTKPLYQGELSPEWGQRLSAITENLNEAPDPENSTFEDDRYYGIQKKDPDFFRNLLFHIDENCGGYIKKRYGNAMQHFVLYNEIIGQGSSEGSGGGWHRDSFIHQYKVILYLTDVEGPGKGAFEFVRGTSRGVVRLFDYLKRWGKKSITRYDSVPKSEPIFGKKYSYFMINTSAIHRGSPLDEGVTRKAITFYLFDKIPAKFLAYT